MLLPENKQKTLDAIVNDLKSVDNLAAIVLGGSYCTGMANENSDLDIGLYYHPQRPFDIEAIKTIAAKHHTGEQPTVTGFYQWGTWVNGGAWLHTPSGEVDFIYRNTEQVKATIENCKKGIWENDFEQQPPYGFSSVIYLAETHYCLPLYDPQDIISALKQEVAQYPARLKSTIVQQALWSAQFSLWQADKLATRQDMYNTAGCITRALKQITEALFALNEMYSISDKYALKQLVYAPNSPLQLEQQINQVLNLQADSLAANTERLRRLFNEAVSLAGEGYRPYFDL